MKSPRYNIVHWLALLQLAAMASAQISDSCSSIRVFLPGAPRRQVPLSSSPPCPRAFIIQSSAGAAHTGRIRNDTDGDATVLLVPECGADLDGDICVVAISLAVFERVKHDPSWTSMIVVGHLPATPELPLHRHQVQCLVDGVRPGNPNSRQLISTCRRDSFATEPRRKLLQESQHFSMHPGISQAAQHLAATASFIPPQTRRRMVILMLADFNSRLYLLNALSHIYAHEVHQVGLVCLDTQLASWLEKRGFSDCPVLARRNTEANDNTEIWMMRLALVEHLHRQHIDVLVTDLDAIWLDNPFHHIHGGLWNAAILAQRGSYPTTAMKQWGSTLCMGFAYFSASQGTSVVFAAMHHLRENSRLLADDQVLLNDAVLVLAGVTVSGVPALPSYSTYDWKWITPKESCSTGSASQHLCLPSSSTAAMAELDKLSEQIRIGFLPTAIFPRSCPPGPVSSWKVAPAIVHCYDASAAKLEKSKLTQLQERGLWNLKTASDVDDIEVGPGQSWVGWVSSLVKNAPTRSCRPFEVRRFLRGATPPTLLVASLPNTAAVEFRQLLEFSTGWYTGSLHEDEQIKKLLPGQGNCDNVLAVAGSLGSVKLLAPEQILPAQCHFDRFERVIVLLSDIFEVAAEAMAESTGSEADLEQAALVAVQSYSRQVRQILPQLDTLSAHLVRPRDFIGLTSMSASDLHLLMEELAAFLEQDAPSAQRIDCALRIAQNQSLRSVKTVATGESLDPALKCRLWKEGVGSMHAQMFSSTGMPPPDC